MRWVTYNTHGARGTIDVHPIGAVMAIEIFASVLIETAAPAHDGGFRKGLNGVMMCARLTGTGGVGLPAGSVAM